MNVAQFLLQWVIKAFSHKTNHILFIPSNELGLSSSRERYSEHLQPSVKPSGHTWFWAAFKSVLGTLPKLVPSEFDPQHNIIWKPDWQMFPFFQHDNDPKHPSIVVKAYLDRERGDKIKQNKKKNHTPLHNWAPPVMDWSPEALNLLQKAWENYSWRLNYKKACLRVQAVLKNEGGPRQMLAFNIFKAFFFLNTHSTYKLKRR